MKTEKFTTVIVVATTTLILNACAELKQAGKTIGHTTRDITREIGHASRDAVNAVGKESKKVVNAVKDEINND
ncbi:MAG: hypothetical protein ACPG52_10045 [Cognaticolwellia sp.]